MFNRHRHKVCAPLSLLMLTATANGGASPRYTAEGSLIPPTDYREWVYLSSGLDMSYSEGPSMVEHMFDNVFVDPGSWAAFKRTGHWPDKTIFAMESRGASSKGSINSRFKGGWGFFAQDGTGPAALLPQSAPCYACYLAHGAVDTTFTQFYPTAKAIAMKAGTFKDQ